MGLAPDYRNMWAKLRLRLPYFSVIRSDLLAIAGALLDAYVAHAQKKRKHEQDRIYWVRRRNAIIVAEQFVDASGVLVGRDAARFEYFDGRWHLYCIDASRKWRRYTVAPPDESFAAVFRHFRADATGIFRSRLVTSRRQAVSDADIERDALAMLIGKGW